MRFAMSTRFNPFLRLFFAVLVMAIAFSAGKLVTAFATGADRMYYFNSNGTQGNLILVESNGSWGLLDAGHRFADTILDDNGRIISTPQSRGLSSQISMRNGKDVANYMINHLGVTHLDFIVGTHAHSDHIGGIPEIATTSFRDASGQTRYLVDSNTTFYYKEYQHIANFEDDLVTYSNTSWHNQAYAYQATKTMQEQGANMVDVSRQQVIHGDPGNAYGDYITFTMGNMTFRLYNVHEQTNTGNENVNSIVTVLTNDDYTVVNLSDINTNNGAIDKTSQAINKDYGKVDVVVAGHHGYAGSNTKNMFDELQPDYVVISNGSDQNSWLYTNGDLAAAIPYAQGLFGTSFFSTALSPYAIVTDLSGNQVYVYNLEYNGNLTNAFYKAIRSSHKTGWVSWVNTNETLWSYLENGKPKKNTWERINSKWYHFDKDGIMQTGWFYEDNIIRYLDENGALTVGWKEIDGKWYYFENQYGDRVTNRWERIDKKWYYFNEAGIMQKGWVTDEGGTRYCNDSGALVTGWQYVDGKWYFLEGEYGYRVTDAWQRIDKKWYFFNEAGEMQKGWVKDEGGTRYCDENGALVTGWRQINGNWYFFESEYGYRVTDAWQRVDKKWYYFDKDGVMQTGWVTDEGGTRYCDESGALITGWRQIDGKWFFFEDQFGYVSTNGGWQRINNKMYYFDGNGDMQTGWLTDEGGTRYCDENGALVTGWRQINGNWYFFESEYGYRVTDAWQRVDKKWYYFDKDGVMQTGWVTDEGGTRYCDENGALVTGWRQIYGNWYFFESEYGYRVTDAWQRVDKKWYYFDKDGVMQTGWVTDEGGTRYCNESGALISGWQWVDGQWRFFEENFGYVQTVTGWNRINGVMHYFDENGVMQTGWLMIEDRTRYLDDSGNMLTGWQWIDDKCYFFSYEDGNMARDAVVEGYYVDADGVWIPDR